VGTKPSGQFVSWGRAVESLAWVLKEKETRMTAVRKIKINKKNEEFHPGILL